MNIPNILTVFRLFLIPVFVMVFFSQGEHHLLWSMMIFLLAGATDLLDGYIARRYNLITQIGTLMDPLADKLMLITVLVCLAIQNFIPFWIAALVILKETVMILGSIRLYYSKHNIVIPANHFGKAATAAFYLAVILICISGGGAAGRAAVYAALGLTAAALFNYRGIAVEEMKKARKKGHERASDEHQ